MDSNNVWIISSSIGTLVAGGAAVASWYMARKLFALQASIEAAKRPFVHIWCNRNHLIGDKFVATFTILNLGATALPIRTLRILTGTVTEGNALKIWLQDRTKELSPKEDGHGLKQEIVDLMLIPNEIVTIGMNLESSQVRFEIMYYDNSFEFIEVDTSILGGNYILTGIGKKSWIESDESAKSGHWRKLLSRAQRFWAEKFFARRSSHASQDLALKTSSFSWRQVFPPVMAVIVAALLAPGVLQTYRGEVLKKRISVYENFANSIFEFILQPHEVVYGWELHKKLFQQCTHISIFGSTAASDSCAQITKTTAAIATLLESKKCSGVRLRDCSDLTKTESDQRQVDIRNAALHAFRILAAEDRVEVPGPLIDQSVRPNQK